MMRFLAGDSAMARMIRSRDWSQHPFGSTDQWPQSLRSALSICLHSAFPTAIYWGPELRLLYNDAWAPIPGPRHPAALGAPAREVWADIWPVIGPQFEQLMATGEGVFVEDQMLPMQRTGLPEETYWSYSFTAIRGEDGVIVGIFNSGSETTHKVRQQRQNKYLLELENYLSTVHEADRMWSTGAKMLARHLSVDSVQFGEIFDLDSQVTSLTGEKTRSGATSENLILALDGQHRGTLLAGHELAIGDRSLDPAAPETGVAGQLRAVGARAMLAVPSPKSEGSALVALLTSSAPRSWSPYDISAAHETLSRLAGAVDRERAAERERIMVQEIDHRSRNALATALSILRLTRAQTIEEFRSKIEDRVSALARVHSLLASEHWLAVDLRTLIGQELAPFTFGDNQRARLSGKPVRLPSDIAQAVTLVFHELATNAVKHGALRREDGRLEVEWSVNDQGICRLVWSEHSPTFEPSTGGAQVDGIGSALLSRVVRSQLRGVIEKSYSADGLRCVLRFALDGRQQIEAGAGDIEREEMGERAKRVLIAEDETLIAMDVEQLVVELGYSIFGVHNTLESALAVIEQDLPDLALLDANLMGQSTVPLAMALARRGVPIIFSTGYNSLPDLPAELAAVPKLKKPITEEALAAAIEEALQPKLAGASGNDTVVSMSS